MPTTHRGLIAPAIITSTIILIACSIGWGALGVVSFTEPETLPTAAHRYLCILLATATTCSAAVLVTTRALRSILAGIAAIRAGEGAGDGYAEGYADGLSAAPVSPAVSRLVPARR